MSHYNGHTANSSNKKFHRSESVPNVTKRLVEMLDHVEERVELLREHAAAVESEKNALLQILTSISSHKDLELLSEGEREEMEITAQRLLNRTSTVEVRVNIPRNELQKEALNKVNKLYEDLLDVMKSDHINARALAQEYMNSCLSDTKGRYNQKFQAAILECTADDQKGIRKQLQSLLSSMPNT